MKAMTLEPKHAIKGAKSGTTLFSPNYAPGESFLKFPETGTVDLYYGPGSPKPAQVVIFHQGGVRTPVLPGQGRYTVESDAYLEIEGDAASCKIQFYYV